MWRCHLLLSGFLDQRTLVPSVTSVTTVANDRVKMKWSRGLCTDLLAFASKLRKSPETSDGRPSDEAAVRPLIASNGASFLHLRSVESHSTSGREWEGKEGGTGRYITSIIKRIFLHYYCPLYLTYMISRTEF